MFYKPSLNHFSGCNHEQMFKRRNWDLCLWILVLKSLAICTWLQLEGSAERYKVRMNVTHLSQWSYVGAFLYWTNICSLKLCALLQFLSQFCISSCGQMFQDMRWWSWAGRNVSLLKTVISDGWVTKERISQKLLFWWHDWEVLVFSRESFEYLMF